MSTAADILRPPARFETARLLARPPRAEDAPAVFDTYASDPEATRYLAWKPYTELAPLAAFLDGRARAWETGGDIHYPYLLHRRDTGALIGSIGVFIEEPKAMFGYVIGRAHWGHGYATEALTFLVEWATAEPRLRRAWAYCAAENAASIRVMEKAGLQREGLLRRWQKFPNLGPAPRDCVFYSKVT